MSAGATHAERGINDIAERVDWAGGDLFPQFGMSAL